MLAIAVTLGNISQVLLHGGIDANTESDLGLPLVIAVNTGQLESACCSSTNKANITKLVSCWEDSWGKVHSMQLQPLSTSHFSRLVLSEKSIPLLPLTETISG